MQNVLGTRFRFIHTFLVNALRTVRTITDMAFQVIFIDSNAIGLACLSIDQNLNRPSDIIDFVSWSNISRNSQYNAMVILLMKLLCLIMANRFKICDNWQHGLFLSWQSSSHFINEEFNQNVTYVVQCCSRYLYMKYTSMFPIQSYLKWCWGFDTARWPNKMDSFVTRESCLKGLLGL